MTIRVLSFLALLFCLASPAHADTIYTYTGDYFGTYTYNGQQLQPRVASVYTTADRITGSFTVADGFVPTRLVGGDAFTPGVLSYAFTDGNQTLTQANSIGTFNLFFDVFLNDVTMWNIAIGAPTGGAINTWVFGDRQDYARLDANNWGANGSDVGLADGSHRGTWTVTTVPEPMSLLLVAAGIGGVVLARGRRAAN